MVASNFNGPNRPKTNPHLWPWPIDDTRAGLKSSDADADSPSTGVCREWEIKQNDEYQNRVQQRRRFAGLRCSISFNLPSRTSRCVHDHTHSQQLLVSLILGTTFTTPRKFGKNPLQFKPKSFVQIINTIRPRTNNNTIIVIFTLNLGIND